MDLTTRVRTLLEGHWDRERGWCVPNPTTYPHLWLWDSCFHAIVWAHLDDQRAVTELEAVLAGRTPAGMVPHMRYGGGPPDTFLGPLASSSSLTQPPLYGHAAAVLIKRGFTLPNATIDGIRQTLDWLWTARRTEDDLLFIVHPWEAGNDHSPRWDDWGAPGRSPADYDRAARTAWNKARMHDVEFDADGAAVWSRSFVAAPAGFNAYAAYTMEQFGEVTGDEALIARGRRIAAAMDSHLWNEQTRMWSDQAIVGGGESVHLPISDGVMGALATHDEAKAKAALTQLTDPDRFGARFGPANVVRTLVTYDPDMYWRGPAWPPLNYLFVQALMRHRQGETARQIAAATVAGAEQSGWAEYWNPETGEGRGAAPQTWTGLALAATDDAREVPPEAAV